jgi:hypothetical protein
VPETITPSHLKVCWVAARAATIQCHRVSLLDIRTLSADLIKVICKLPIDGFVSTEIEGRPGAGMLLLHAYGVL